MKLRTTVGAAVRVAWVALMHLCGVLLLMQSCVSLELIIGSCCMLHHADRSGMLIPQVQVHAALWCLGLWWTIAVYILLK
jgi:hypothetical protein